MEKKTVQQLKDICDEKGIAASGVKAVIVARLVNYFEEHPDEIIDDVGERENGGGDNAAGNNNQNNDANVEPANQRRTNEFENNRRPVFSFKDIEESLEKFDGESNKDVNQWLDDFEEQSIIFGWAELEKLVYARRLLAGSAKLYANCELRPKTWIQLKAGLIREFEVKVNSALVHEQLRDSKKKKNESYREFCYRMIEMAAPAKIETAAVITYIVNGINDTMTNKMFLYSAISLNDLKEKIRVYEEAMKNDTMKSDKTATKDKEKDKQSDRKSIKNSKSRRCYGFGSDQHKSRECPDKDKGPKCFSCNSFGHKSQSCPEKKEDQTKKFEKPATNILIVPDRKRVKKEVVINDKKMVSLFDTGI